jgi:hypothetical protein
MPKLRLTQNVLIVFGVPLGFFFLLTLAFFIFTSFFIYWPDVIFANEHTLATYETDSGDVVALTQFWNRGDFYSTLITRTDAAGTVYEVVVDPDDNKIWRADVEMTDKGGRIAFIINSEPTYWVDTNEWLIARGTENTTWERGLDVPYQVTRPEPIL